MIYNSYGEKYTFNNHFPFELWIKNGHKHFYLNALLFLSALFFAGNFIIDAIINFAVIKVTIAILALLVSFSLLAIFYLPLTKFKERCFCSIAFFIANAGVNGLILYYEVKEIRIFENYLAFIPLAISLIILIICIYDIFNPKIFDFSTTKDESGEQIRPKIFHLALGEWLLIFTFLFSQIYLLI